MHPVAHVELHASYVAATAVEEGYTLCISSGSTCAVLALICGTLGVLDALVSIRIYRVYYVCTVSSYL